MVAVGDDDDAEAAADEDRGVSAKKEAAAAAACMVVGLDALDDVLSISKFPEGLIPLLLIRGSMGDGDDENPLALLELSIKESSGRSSVRSSEPIRLNEGAIDMPGTDEEPLMVLETKRSSAGASPMGGNDEIRSN